MEFKKAIKYDITIKASLNGGYFVEVGCCKLAYTDPKQLTKDLLDYLQEPEKVEKAYNELQPNPSADVSFDVSQSHGAFAQSLSNNYRPQSPFSRYFPT
jgi:hypothetical protein